MPANTKRRACRNRGHSPHDPLYLNIGPTRNHKSIFVVRICILDKRVFKPAGFITLNRILQIGKIRRKYRKREGKEYKKLSQKMFHEIFIAMCLAKVIVESEADAPREYMDERWGGRGGRRIECIGSNGDFFYVV